MDRVKFSKNVVLSDKFMSMPHGSQVLYYHICFKADKNGFINSVNSTARGCGCKEEDITRLVDEGFLRCINPYEYKIVHWDENNKSDARKRNSYTYRAWRKSVIERDSRCVICGSTKNLEAHHIKPFAVYPELRLDINNGQTLCRVCHRLLHKKEKVKDNG